MSLDKWLNGDDFCDADSNDDFDEEDDDESQSEHLNDIDDDDLQNKNELDHETQEAEIIDDDDDDEEDGETSHDIDDESQDLEKNDLDAVKLTKLDAGMIGYPYLTKYERAAVLMQRTAQFAKNAPYNGTYHIPPNTSMTTPEIYYKMALQELNDNILPMALVRNHSTKPNMSYTLPLKNLEIIDF